MEDDNEKNSDNIKKSVNSKQESENKVIEQKISDALSFFNYNSFCSINWYNFFYVFRTISSSKI